MAFGVLFDPVYFPALVFVSNINLNKVTFIIISLPKKVIIDLGSKGFPVVFPLYFKNNNRMLLLCILRAIVIISGIIMGFYFLFGIFFIYLKNINYVLLLLFYQNYPYNYFCNYCHILRYN